MVRAATLSGVRHRLAGTGPEDAYAWALGAASGLFVAVADGVSNREGSAAAAAAAATAAVTEAARPLDAAAGETNAGETASARGTATAGETATADPQAAAARQVHAANDAVRAAGGATTLVVAALDPSGSVELVRVGDSSAFVLSAGAWTEVWAAPGDDGTIRTATLALPAEAPEGATALVHLAPGDVLVLATDGVADPLRDGPTTVAPGLAAALALAPEPLELARVLDFSRQGCSDDRTLLAVWRAPAS